MTEATDEAKAEQYAVKLWNTGRPSGPVSVPAQISKNPVEK